jgi:hypothetical protein
MDYEFSIPDPETIHFDTPLQAVEYFNNLYEETRKELEAKYPYLLENPLEQIANPKTKQNIKRDIESSIKLHQEIYSLKPEDIPGIEELVDQGLDIESFVAEFETRQMQDREPHVYLYRENTPDSETRAAFTKLTNWQVRYDPDAKVNNRKLTQYEPTKNENDGFYQSDTAMDIIEYQQNQIIQLKQQPIIISTDSSKPKLPTTVQKGINKQNQINQWRIAILDTVNLELKEVQDSGGDKGYVNQTPQLPNNISYSRTKEENIPMPTINLYLTAQMVRLYNKQPPLDTKTDKTREHYPYSWLQDNDGLFALCGHFRHIDGRVNIFASGVGNSDVFYVARSATWGNCGNLLQVGNNDTTEDLSEPMDRLTSLGNNL